MFDLISPEPGTVTVLAAWQTKARICCLPYAIYLLNSIIHLKSIFRAKIITSVKLFRDKWLLLGIDTNES